MKKYLLEWKRALTTFLAIIIMLCNASSNGIIAYASSETIAEVHMVAGETYLISANENTNFMLSGNAIYNDGMGNGGHFSQYINNATVYSMQAGVWTEITVVSGEILLKYDNNLTVKKIDHNALNVYILMPNESIEINSNGGSNEPIYFNCYNSGIAMDFSSSLYNWTDTKKVSKTTKSGTLTWSSRSYDTLRITSKDGVSVISLNYYTGKRCSVSKSSATVEDAWMLYHPFSVKEKDVSIDVGDEYPLTITSNINGYNPDVKFYIDGSLYYEGWEQICPNLAVKMNINKKAIKGIGIGKHKLGIKDPDTGYTEYCNVNVSEKKKPVNKQHDCTLSRKISVSVTGKFKDGQTKSNFGDTETYRDDYFTNTSTRIQGGLATLSMLASASVYKKAYAERLMGKCKFKYRKYVKNKPTKSKNDTISYQVGYRKIDDIVIVAVWVKGTSNDYEWVSNWNLGKKNVHSGFIKAEKMMNKGIKSYLRSKNISLSSNGRVKLWITGHSRGAAIANLYAERMNNIVGKENVYAYTFASPRVSKSAKKSGYENIFNYCNPGDFVTEVAPRGWGYDRYGIDKPLPLEEESAMKKMFKKVSSKGYKGFGITGKKSLLRAFLEYAPSHDAYYKKKRGYSPAYFCKKGLALCLIDSTLKSGVKNCLKVCKRNKRASKVFAKMVVDGKINKKFGYAHTQLGYLCWLKKIYKSNGSLIRCKK